MGLRKKLIYVIALTSIVMVSLIYWLTSSTLQKGFHNLENQSAQANVQAVLNAIQDRLLTLNATAADWAFWDDMYAFAEDENAQFIRANLYADAVSVLHVNLLLVVAPDGKVIYGQMVDLTTSARLPIPAEIFPYLNDQALLHPNLDDINGKTGIIPLGDSIMLVASRPILTSNKEGPPHGAVVIGRILDREELDHLSRLTSGQISIAPLNPSALGNVDITFLPIAMDFLNTQFFSDAFITASQEENNLPILITLKDINGREINYLRMDLPRPIHQQAVSTLRLVAPAIILPGLISLIIFLVSLDRVVISRTLALNRSVHTISATHDLSLRIPQKGGDEISSLAGEINFMVQELQKSEDKLRAERDVLQNLMQTSPVGILITDRKGYVGYASEEAKRIARIKQELYGVEIDPANPGNWRPFTSAEIEELFLSVRDSKTPARNMLHKISLADEDYYISINMSPLLNSQQETEEMLITLDDISLIKKAEEKIKAQLQRLDALQKIDSSILLQADLQSTIHVFLEQARQQLNIAAADIILWDEKGDKPVYFQHIGLEGSDLENTTLNYADCRERFEDLHNLPFRIPNLQEAPDGFKSKDLLTANGFQAYYGLPLSGKQGRFGVFEIFNHLPVIPNQEWLDFLGTLSGQVSIAIENNTLLNNLREATLEVTLAYDATLESWARVLELRDFETAGHTRRVTDLAIFMSSLMGISGQELVSIQRGAILHDIGKLGIPDQILLKPGPLSPEEWQVMRCHTIYAYDLLDSIPFLRDCLDIPYCHHEKWDGTGYPRSLKGEEIPLSARIFALVDVWDALNHDRVYHKKWPMEDILRMIQEQSGKHFDPHVVEIFLAKAINEKDFTTY